MEDITEIYKDMLIAFAQDFELACDNDVKYSLADLQKEIKNKNKVLLKDINLLLNLSFYLRYDKIKILKLDCREV